MLCSQPLLESQQAKVHQLFELCVRDARQGKRVVARHGGPVAPSSDESLLDEVSKLRGRSGDCALIELREDTIALARDKGGRDLLHAFCLTSTVQLVTHQTEE